MQQRQLRLGDILDDYCPRERRLTNHAVVAMVGDEVKQTRCTTCDAEHEFKHAKVPRQRRRNDPSAVLQAPAAAAAAVPKRVVQGARVESGEESVTERLIDINAAPQSEVAEPDVAESDVPEPDAIDVASGDDAGTDVGDGPAHRRLIRATLPRQEGQQPPARPAPDFTIRQPATGRPNRFRPRHQRGGASFQGNRSNQPGGPTLTGVPRQGNTRPPMASRSVKRHDSGRKRSK
jgi:hypothetical protein